MNSEVTGFFQYLFVITPSPSVREEVIAFKKELSNQIGKFSSLDSEPHITIGTITLSIAKEEALLERIQYVCHYSDPFEVELEGFGSFKPHTVYARLGDSSFIRSFMRACEEATQGLPSKKGWQPKAKNPHMTIGRELGSKFKQSKELFVNRQFQARFKVTNLRVMRREIEGRYSIITELPFQSQ